jgi:hypothetical protein
MQTTQKCLCLKSSNTSSLLFVMEPQAFQNPRIFYSYIMSFNKRFATVKVILLADSIRSRLLAWFGSPIIKKLPKYHPPNVYGYIEI